MTALVGAVLANPRRVGFYRAIEIIERATPRHVRVGEYGPVLQESIRFKHDPSLNFSTNDVSEVAVRPRKVGETGDGPDGPYYEVTTTFLGLTGTVSPLPTYFAEEILNEDPDNTAQRDFLDVFHHRVLSLFYRAHAKYAFITEYLSTSDDGWSKKSLALSGIDVFEGGRPPANLALGRFLRLTPLLATRSRTAAGLVAVVGDVLEDVLLGAKVAVEQFVGRWVTIEERQLLRLGVINTTLGVDATIGRRVFDRGGKFRLVLGPMKRKVFQRFLPGGDGLTQLKDLVTFYVRDPLDFDVELILAPGETPSLRLSSNPDEASRIGLDSWLTVGADRETRVIVPVPLNTISGADPVETPPDPDDPGGAPHGTAR